MGYTARPDLMTSRQFVSTRDSDRRGVDFRQALHRGLAPDGGLYVPASVPRLPQGWDAPMEFGDLASLVMRQWLVGTINDEEVDRSVKEALNFPVHIVDLVGEWEGVKILELFHGPTLSFKDFGARTMARLMAASTDEREIVILVATSGDTGSAVADGFSGIPGIRVVLLYPQGQVSPIQERQLIIEREGVTPLRVEGTFDDCQRLVKGAFSDPELSRVRLSSANSINIGRLLPQSLYYTWAGAQTAGQINVCVPSGNLGNLTAAVLAWKSGVEIAGFLAAHNENRFFPDYLDGREQEFPASVRTLSNAMDVGAPSNFERLDWLLGRAGMREAIVGEVVSDAATLDSMKRVFQGTGYVADPHTAVGLEAVRRRGRSWRKGRPVLVASTAHPAKFPETVEKATDRSPETPVRLAALWDMPVSHQAIPATAQALREAILTQ